MKKLLLILFLAIPFLLHAQTTADVSDKSYQPYSQNKKQAYQFTAGDYLQKSSYLKFTSYALGTFTGIMFATGSYDNIANKNVRDILIVSSVGATMGFFIAGEIMVIKAGKALNREAVTLTPASQGIGMAINF